MPASLLAGNSLGFGIIVLLFMPCSHVAASDSHSHEKAQGITSDEALKNLVDGNSRFASGEMRSKDLGRTRRDELVKGQKPFAVVLSCSDSRVPPEHIFDQGLGDIFIVRVAGNVADPVEIGSIEYAVAHLGTPLIIVLGHQNCGAVNAAVHDAKDSGHIIAIVKKIKPAVKKARTVAKDKDSVLDAAIIENAKITASELTKRSEILRHKVESGELKIVAGIYSLSTGKVDIIDMQK